MYHMQDAEKGQFFFFGRVIIYCSSEYYNIAARSYRIIRRDALCILRADNIMRLCQCVVQICVRARVCV